MTRNEDKDLADSDTRGYSRRKVEDLKKRLKMINDNDNDLFVSIHLMPFLQRDGAEHKPFMPLILKKMPGQQNSFRMSFG